MSAMNEAQQRIHADPIGRSLEQRLVRVVGRLHREFELLESGDRVMVCLSGGKDSWAMLHLLAALRRRLPFDFEIVAVHLDQGQPGHQVEPLERYLKQSNFEYRIVEADTYSAVVGGTPAGKSYCALCSRFRRGILYRVADELSATKIALGHHRDDVIETMLLNLVHAGQLKAMPCKLRSDDGRHTLIRPLARTAESDLRDYARSLGVPILPCNLCGSQSGLQRERMRELLVQLEREQPRVREHMFAALGNVKETHLYDKELTRVQRERTVAPMQEPADALEDGPPARAAKPARIRFNILP